MLIFSFVLLINCGLIFHSGFAVITEFPIEPVNGKCTLPIEEGLVLAPGEEYHVNERCAVITCIEKDAEHFSLIVESCSKLPSFKEGQNCVVEHNPSGSYPECCIKYHCHPRSQAKAVEKRQVNSLEFSKESDGSVKLSDFLTESQQQSLEESKDDSLEIFMTEEQRQEYLAKKAEEEALSDSLTESQKESLEESEDDSVQFFMTEEQRQEYLAKKAEEETLTDLLTESQEEILSNLYDKSQEPSLSDFLTKSQEEILYQIPFFLFVSCLEEASVYWNLPSGSSEYDINVQKIKMLKRIRRQDGGSSEKGSDELTNEIEAQIMKDFITCTDYFLELYDSEESDESSELSESEEERLIAEMLECLFSNPNFLKAFELDSDIEPEITAPEIKLTLARMKRQAESEEISEEAKDAVLYFFIGIFQCTGGMDTDITIDSTEEETSSLQKRNADQDWTSSEEEAFDILDCLLQYPSVIKLLEENTDSHSEEKTSAEIEEMLKTLTEEELEDLLLVMQCAGFDLDEDDFENGPESKHKQKRGDDFFGALMVLRKRALLFVACLVNDPEVMSSFNSGENIFASVLKKRGADYAEDSTLHLDYDELSADEMTLMLGALRCREEVLEYDETLDEEESEEE